MEHLYGPVPPVLVIVLVKNLQVQVKIQVQEPEEQAQNVTQYLNRKFRSKFYYG